MAQVDVEYKKLLRNVLNWGTEKTSRAGDTLSLFSEQIRLDVGKEFPILSTKKMAMKQIITELLWFLSGDTNVKTLIDQGNYIWVGDAYKNYCKIAGSVKEPDYDIHVDDPNQNCTRLMTQEEFIDRIKTDDEFAKKWGDLGKIYGYQWVNWTKFECESIDYDEWYPSVDGINQIQNAIDTLKTNPDSRRIMVSAWNVGELDQMILPPCHWAFEFYTEELTWKERREIAEDILDKDTLDKFGYISPFTDKIIHYWLDSHKVPKYRLHLKWHQRSVDLPLGLPFNITSYALLLHMFAQQTNMIVGTLIGDLTNVHIYKNQIEGVREQINRDVTLYPAPTLKLNKADDMFSYKLEDFELEGYESYPKIKFPLSN